MQQVAFQDSKDRFNTLKVEEVETKKEAKEDFKKWVPLKDISQREKSREVCLQEGDRNTSLFHKTVNAHNRNFLDKIKINGTRFSKENEIKDGVVQAFQNLLANPEEQRPSINGLSFDGQENKMLQGQRSHSQLKRSCSPFWTLRECQILMASLWHSDSLVGNLSRTR